MIQLDTMRKWLGVSLIDLPRHRRMLKQPGRQYLAIANRSDTLDIDNNGAVRLEGECSSALLSAKYYPSLARRLLQRSIQEYPIELSSDGPEYDTPQISVVIGHRGSTTLPNLLATLDSFACQSNVQFEVIVVEQDDQSRLSGVLPPWVRHVFIETAPGESKYCRSWGFNVGIHNARADTVLLHDNDMLVPKDYCAQHLATIQAGFDVATLKRFIFYLNKASSQRFLQQQHSPFNDLIVEAVVQSHFAGGSVAVSKAFYLSIGGMDEDFIGWGGEDTEFWQRCQIGRIHAHGHLPTVHLWHPSQPGKRAKDGQGGFTTELYNSKRLQPITERIATLQQRTFGEASNPPRSTG